MKILLIQPKMNKRPMDTDLKTHMSPPLSLLTLVRLTPQEHEICIVNENIEKIDFDDDADLVGITITLDVMPRACRIAEKFRARNIPVVAGGIHVTCDPQSCEGHFTAICVGAAERVWGVMLQDAARQSLKPVYRDMENFGGYEIVSPQYDAIDRKVYLYTNVVTTSRGCPDRCDFCYNSGANRVYVQRPIPDVIRDIQALGTRHILFIDDNFSGVPAYTRALLQALKPLHLHWSAAVTTKIGDHPALLDLMAETGCQSLFIGFESVNAASLRGVHKNNRVEQYESLIEALHSRGIMINASIVFGLDSDGPDVFDKTLEWLVQNRIETVTAHILTPYPGTKLYERMRAAGRITNPDLSQYNTAHVVFKPQNMSPEALYRGYVQFYRRFYSFRNIILRCPQNKAQRRGYWLFNLCYRKFGRVSALLTKVIPMRILGRLAARLSYQRHLPPKSGPSRAPRSPEKTSSQMEARSLFRGADQ